MPTPEQAFAAVLVNDPTTVGYCTGGIWSDQAPAQSTNYLVFQCVSDVEKKNMSGQVYARRLRFQLTGRFDSRVNTGLLLAQLLSLLDGKINAELGGLAVNSSMVPDDPDEGAVDEDEAPRPGEHAGYRVVRLDVIWWIVP